MQHRGATREGLLLPKLCIAKIGLTSSPPDPNDEESEGVNAVADDFVASTEGEGKPETLQSRVRR